MVDGGLEVREEGADLAGDSLGLDGGLDGSAIGVAEDEDDLGSEDGGAVFEAADDFRRYDVTGDAGDEDVSDGLVEDDLDGQARVGAGEDGGEGLLLVDGVGCFG